MTTILRDKVTSVVDGITTTFNDDPAKPAGAIVWGLDALLGWDETSDLDVISTPLGGGVDGETTSDFFAARARHMIVGGYCKASSRAEAEALHDLLLRDAFPRNKEIVLTRWEVTPKFMTLRVSDRREISRVGPEMFRWTVPVMAPDPFKYALTAVTGGPVGVAGQSSGGRTYPRTYPLSYVTTSDGSENSFTLVNAGTADTNGIFTIHGPLVRGGWRLENSTIDEDIRFDVGLTATDILVIDFREQIALVNGFPVTATILGDFWKVVPGPNIIRLFADFDPVATVAGTIYSAWE